MNNCHCSKCRKATGAAFGSFVHVDARDFEWLGGQEQIRGFESSPGMVRAFCSACGASVPFDNSDMGQVVIPAGLLDDEMDARPDADIFTADRLPWYEIPPAAVAFEGEESESFWQAYLARSEARQQRG